MIDGAADFNRLQLWNISAYDALPSKHERSCGFTLLSRKCYFAHGRQISLLHQFCVSSSLLRSVDAFLYHGFHCMIERAFHMIY